MLFVLGRMRIIPVAIAIPYGAVFPMDSELRALSLSLLATSLDGFCLSIVDSACTARAFSFCRPSVFVRNHMNVFL